MSYSYFELLIFESCSCCDLLVEKPVERVSASLLLQRLYNVDIWDIVPRVELCAKITFGIEQIDESLILVVVLIRAIILC